jgi:hypothetical protein
MHGILELSLQLLNSLYPAGLGAYISSTKTSCFENALAQSLGFEHYQLTLDKAVVLERKFPSMVNKM